MVSEEIFHVIVILLSFLSDSPGIHLQQRLSFEVCLSDLDFYLKGYQKTMSRNVV